MSETSLLTLPSPDVLSPERAKALVFEDSHSRALLERVRKIAPTDATVLITGETGTGKEIVARHIHERSHRRAQPFVAVNCGALSESLVESELFGHERGAFTGAVGAKPGWFEAAQGGTLFLDEVGDLPLPIQVKLLRVLQEREVVRIGAREPIAIDVRLVAATNANLEEAVAAGDFREDLYYRLHVAALALAPLRERRGDILPLARYFLELYCGRLGTRPALLAKAAEERLLSHPWPGNIRELENVIHHAVVVCHGNRITPDDLRLTIPRRNSPHVTTSSLESALLELFEQNGPNLHERVEETLMRTAYRYCERNQLQTARLLGISRNVVRARLIQFGDLVGPPRQRGSHPAQAVRIGYQKFGLLTLLKARGSLDRALAERGTAVEWHDFPGGIQLVDAVQDGRIDLGVVGEVPPIFAQAAGAPIVYLAAEPPAPECEAIVVHPDSPIRSVADLKGKTVALNRGANVDYLLIRALEEAGLRYDDVRLSFVPPTGARAAFESREVDAWAIWNPFLACLEHTAGARILRDGRGLTRNTAYYIGRRDFADAHPKLIEVFLSEVGAVGKWANENTPAATEMLASALSMPRAALSRWLGRSRFGQGPVDVTAQQEVADTFSRLKLIPRTVRVAEARWSPPNEKEEAAHGC